MKKKIFFLILVLVLISSCSKEEKETAVGDNRSNESAANTTYPKIEPEIIKKEKATLNINMVRSGYYEENEPGKGRFLVLQLEVENADNYGGFVDVKASCLRRDEKGGILLNNVRYIKAGVIEKSFSIKANEVGILKAEGCFEKATGKTDRISIDDVKAYRFVEEEILPTRCNAGIFSRRLNYQSLPQVLECCGLP